MKKNVSSKISNVLKYRLSPWLKSQIDSLSQSIYSDLGLEINGEKAPRALFIFPTVSFDFYIQGRFEEGLKTKMHNIYFQGLAILKKLIDHGYVVDCVDKDAFDVNRDTSQYRLIIDEGNNLAFLSNYPNQKKIFYSTGLKWERRNLNEQQRINWFHDAYGFFVKPVRQSLPVYSSQVADFILYKGVPEQMQDFNKRAKLVQLAMPVEYEPENIERDYSKREFLWIGGWGAIHKGLDIVVEAFEGMPESKLHIFGPLEREGKVLNWLQDKLKGSKNVFYQGFADYTKSSFQKIIHNCAGHIYPSAGENGCATLAQTAHYGLIPVTTAEANNQASFLGYNIEGDSRSLMIESIRHSVAEISAMDDETLKTKSEKIMAFAKERFTRSAFLKSVDDFLLSVK
ncbi:hypothetical protein [Adhaeribacter terreus]|uniref:Glycosyltransferase n=1 Tax=Adhaeribacter terreus TaxID=529703 RepID=A0ABW0E762_9BACT